MSVAERVAFPHLAKAFDAAEQHRCENEAARSPGAIVTPLRPGAIIKVENAHLCGNVPVRELGSIRELQEPPVSVAESRVRQKARVETAIADVRKQVDTEDKTDEMSVARRKQGKVRGPGKGRKRCPKPSCGEITGASAKECMCGHQYAFKAARPTARR